MTSDRWQLTPESLDSLLDAFGADRQQAARTYEQIRGRLIQLFRWRGCGEPEILADQTLDRVGRKLHEGLEIQSDDPFRYIVSVAHRVFHEVLRYEVRRRETLRAAQDQPQPEPRTEEDRLRLRCLDRCLEELGSDASWILRFYEGEKGVRINNRQQIAAELGITTNALRIRAHRLRSRLEDCVRSCVAAQEAA